MVVEAQLNLVWDEWQWASHPSFRGKKFDGSATSAISESLEMAEDLPFSFGPASQLARHRAHLHADTGHVGPCWARRNREMSFTCQESSHESWGAKPRVTRSRLYYQNDGYSSEN